ncbi:MAG TPA: DNA polymerase [Candidatus Pelethenecus sp.]|nr:DNA polymerase [Candidatus Pelethenecus sp.]
MSRNILWRELKKLNPKTSQQWPSVSVNSIKAEINKIIKTNINKEINKRENIKKRFERKTQKKENKKIPQFLTHPSQNKHITLTADQLLKNLSKLQLNQNYLLEMTYIINGVEEHLVLTNYQNLKDILKLIKQGYNETFAETYGSDTEALYELITYGGDITLTWFNRDNYHKTNNGAYFKYYHNLDIDLSRYQIYNQSQKMNYEGCLYYAFEQAGVEESILDQLKFLIQEKDILLRELNKVAEVINYQLDITYADSRGKAEKRIYGKQFENIIYLGLVDEHYFINEDTIYTSQILTGKRDSRNRKITSYTLIKGLINHKETLLTPITIENINTREHFLGFEKDYQLRDLKKACTCNALDSFDKLDENNINDFENNLSALGRLPTFYKGGKRPTICICKKDKFNEYKEYNKISAKKVFQGRFKKDIDDPNLHYKLCFLDLETYNDEYHKPYCLGYSYEKEDSIKCMYGLDCVEQFLQSLTTNTVIITHNLAFDFRGIIDHLTKFQTPIETGSKLKSIQCKYVNKITGNHYHLLFKDNCAFLPFKLSALPEMFKLPSGDKGVYPYTLITKNNIESHIKLDEVLDHIKAEEHFDFITNCNKVKCLNEDLVDIKKYTIYYCNQDINILKQSYMTFRQQIKEITGLDILTLISLPQLSDEYFKSQGVYDNCYKISGVAQDFIRRSAHGGRVMTSENKKFHIVDKILSDFDAVSLYPSAMHRLSGYVQGIPKLITTQDWFNQDYYFVEIEITNIKTIRSFPLVSIKSDNGIKNYTNDVIGKKLVVDKITLEDLIKFQGIEYKFIRGYYFDNGFNPKIKEVIEFMFNERIKLKKQGNPLQNAYKLILNASYGKLIQKPIKKTKKFYEGDYRNYVIRNAKNIIDYQRINENLICVNQKKSIINHFTGCHMACQVLSMSKRIMNEVMCLAEDNNLKIYYQDTDSMHIEQQHIKILADKYKILYGRELIGKGMGQFHSDFEVNGADKDYEINAVESIFLGKKAYIDKLEYKLDGEIKYDYHIRMKGMPSQIIKNYNDDVMQTYLDLFNGETIELDMVSCCPLELTKGYKAINRIEFKRKMKF